MHVATAKHLLQRWVLANRSHWPGLRAAHLVGSVASLPETAVIPPEKDVDLHLVFDPDSPVLLDPTPWGAPLEAAFGGLMIEAGRKSAAAYASPAAVLANPEIAHHLTVDSILFDPDALLRDLQVTVRREYRHRRWVAARLAHERRGYVQAMGLLPMAGLTAGPSGEANLLGYLLIFPAVALWVASLQPPRGGSQFLVHLKTMLTRHGLPALHEEALSILGVAAASPPAVDAWLAEAGPAFDAAVALRAADPTIAGPFQHKLHAHQRPYFIGACRSMIARGHHREALAWLTPFLFASTDVLRGHGDAAANAAANALQERYLAFLGLDTAARRAVAVSRADRLAHQLFSLADTIAALHPDIVDVPRVYAA